MGKHMSGTFPLPQGHGTLSWGLCVGGGWWGSFRRVKGRLAFPQGEDLEGGFREAPHHPVSMSFQKALKWFLVLISNSYKKQTKQNLATSVLCGPASCLDMDAGPCSHQAYLVLTKHGFGPITTDIREGQEFYYAEDYHQQYLNKNPDGYCGLGGTGVSCPMGIQK
ncbi:Msra [Phodopus roborovskii]|uniref:peptide-methionine (S)-S-oxide reductase n=1 Tax=Phodopus roborovskii TaxID=109678 RepID=A0AAU9ZQ48_PHORO|nr:Msra [Phodopus roborovskii]